jgi:hypothetical protein
MQTVTILSTGARLRLAIFSTDRIVGSIRDLPSKHTPFGFGIAFFRPFLWRTKKWTTGILIEDIVSSPGATCCALTRANRVWEANTRAQNHYQPILTLSHVHKPTNFSTILNVLYNGAASHPFRRLRCNSWWERLYFEHIYREFQQVRPKAETDFCIKRDYEAPA